MLLTVWLAILNFIVAPSAKNKHLYIFLLCSTMLVLSIAFQSKSIISFYLFFEISILPILFLILGWGYQPERISSSFFIFFYTLFGSLPLLIILLYLIVETSSVRNIIIITQISNLRSLPLIILFGAFLIKLPIYYTHIWLPKAHVEAPVVGSIILAGLMLKLGGFGIILCINYSVNLENIFVFTIITVSVVGGGLTRIIIIRLRDIKVIIAYSSVVHMRLITTRLISSSIIRILGVILMIICHGFTSPAIFSGANLIYERSHSRRIVLNKGLLRCNSSLRMLWFLLILLNFGGPLTANLISEILLINILGRVSGYLLLWVGVMCFFSLVYNLILYASLNQGVNITMALSRKISIREILLLTRIILPGFIIPFSRQI